MTFTRKFILIITFGLAFVTNVNGQNQNSWPEKPIKIVVNFPAGSSPDVLARTLAPSLEKKFGQPFYIENRPGNGGLIGANYVLKAPADGYTFLMSAGSTFAIDPYLAKNQDNDFVESFTPVASVARIQLHLVVNSNSEIKDLRSLIRIAKNHPNQLTYGSAGIGTGLHIAGEMLNHYAKIETRHIPYQGSAQALQALLAGQVDFVFDPGVSISHINSGKLRLIAIDSETRSSLFPKTPTFKELGLKELDASTTHTLFASKNTPNLIIKKLHDAINEELKQKNTIDLITNMGIKPHPTSIQEFEKELEKDQAKYKRIVGKLNIE